MTLSSSNKIFFGDNLRVLESLPSNSVNLIYIDPPFNTGRRQVRISMSVDRDDQGDRKGFGGYKYLTKVLGKLSFDDIYDDYLAFLEPRLREAHRVLTANGALYFHIDYREVHYCKILLDSIFGRDNFLNEIIWAYDYGGRSKRKWPTKHDNILYYVKDRNNYVFNADEIDRLPYMAPSLVGGDKAKLGKLPTDVWWQTIVSPTGKEKTGYPTQKPLAILERIIRASSCPGDIVLDFFAGSGTTGVAAHKLGRSFILVDNNEEAIRVMRSRFRDVPVEFITLEDYKYEDKAV